ncbi:hypothetical protein E3U43_005671 [Larimichthys crocea]|uniref:Uncharacterized protein n=1 Tax=Larimichthys crocea TaxID=215358 RepID=A0ACD3QM57_LARCR|nr:hypothetical protein E3U43_005671 [Larimichthys crocea]
MPNNCRIDEGSECTEAAGQPKVLYMPNDCLINGGAAGTGATGQSNVLYMPNHCRIDGWAAGTGVAGQPKVLYMPDDCRIKGLKEVLQGQGLDDNQRYCTCSMTAGTTGCGTGALLDNQRETRKQEETNPDRDQTRQEHSIGCVNPFISKGNKSRPRLDETRDEQRLCMLCEPIDFRRERRGNQEETNPDRDRPDERQAEDASQFRSKKYTDSMFLSDVLYQLNWIVSHTVYSSPKKNIQTMPRIHSREEFIETSHQKRACEKQK